MDIANKLIELKDELQIELNKDTQDSGLISEIQSKIAEWKKRSK